MPSTPEEVAHRTFRDPAGSLELRSGGAYRSVRAADAPEVLRFLSHPLGERLVAEGRLVASEVLPSGPGKLAPEEPLLLRHPRISFISYPWEWSPALWIAAAERTLGLAEDLVREGWILKDATPLNILFEGTRPVLVDVLSIERNDLSRPIWTAYGQFIRTFLLPMLAHVRLGWPLHAALMRRDGYEPEEVYGALHWSSRMRQPALSAVTLPILLDRIVSSRPRAMVHSRATDPELTRHVLLKTFQGLRKQIRRLAPRPRSSTWSHYVDTATHYSEADQARKRAFVAGVLARCRPVRLLDVGSNTGAYSRLAAEAGASVVAIDTDLQAVDQLACSLLACSLKGSNLDILPLCVDLAQPSPATGWENREFASFLARCHGHFDTLMMLAVLHHLLVGSQIPLDRVAALCASLTTRSLILEWVPLEDSKFQQLLRGRDAIYGHLTEGAMRREFSRYFNVERELTLENGRVLFHLTRNAG